MPENWEFVDIQTENKIQIYGFREAASTEGRCEHSARTPPPAVLFGALVGQGIGQFLWSARQARTIRRPRRGRSDRGDPPLRGHRFP